MSAIQIVKRPIRSTYHAKTDQDDIHVRDTHTEESNDQVIGHETRPLRLSKEAKTDSSDTSRLPRSKLI
jgi:hypothetical protein